MAKTGPSQVASAESLNRDVASTAGKITSMRRRAANYSRRIDLFTREHALLKRVRQRVHQRVHKRVHKRTHVAKKIDT